MFGKVSDVCPSVTDKVKGKRIKVKEEAFNYYDQKRPFAFYLSALTSKETYLFNSTYRVSTLKVPAMEVTSVTWLPVKPTCEKLVT